MQISFSAQLVTLFVLGLVIVLLSIINNQLCKKTHGDWGYKCKKSSSGGARSLQEKLSKTLLGV